MAQQKATPTNINSPLKFFLRANKKTKANVFYAASENFIDDDGNPLKWEIKPLSAADNERIKEESTTIIETRDRGFRAHPKVDIKMLQAKQIVASIVFPDLHSTELQNSYGVKQAEDLLFAMLDEAGEYQNLMQFILRYNNMNVPMDDRVEEAKNS